LPEIEAILILLAAVAAPDRLVVGRTYRYVRNPMYVAILTSVTG
jgi:protein-S-isoprenylcysteine O-methyltransferase Ste14